MRRDESVFLIGEDIGVEGGFGGAFGVYLGLVEEFGHERIIDTPISEKAIAGAAVGAALLGMRPIADMQYSDFLFECMDELVNQAAKLRYMSGGKLSVPLVMRAPVGATNSRRAARPVPGELLRARARAEGRLRLGRLPRQGHPQERRSATTTRCSFFEHKLLYGSKGREQAGGLDLTAEVPEEEYLVPASARRSSSGPGGDVTIVATHLSLYRALAAAEELAPSGIECEVIDPADAAAARHRDDLGSVRKTGRLVIVHEDTLTGGWGAEVAARAADECLVLAGGADQAHRVARRPAARRRRSLEDAVVPQSSGSSSAIRTLLRLMAHAGAHARRSGRRATSCGSSWLKGAGEQVAQGEPLLEVETDKATLEVEAAVVGHAARSRCAARATVVAVGEVVAFVG